MRLFEEIAESTAKKALKKLYKDLGFYVNIDGNFESGCVVNVSDTENEFDFFDKNSSGISFGIIQDDGDITINFWSIRLADHYKGHGLARKFIDGYVDILKPKRIIATDVAQEGFCQWLEKAYPNIDVVIED